MYARIFSHLPQRPLKSCRLFLRALSPIAANKALYHVKLSPHIPDSIYVFTETAQSPGLRSKVSEITVNTWLGPGFRYNANDGYKWPVDLLRALPLLRVFPNVRVLHVCFTDSCGNDDRTRRMGPIYYESPDSRWRPSRDESYDFRWRVLNTVFECAAGMWNKHKQLQWDKDVIEAHAGSDDRKNAPEMSDQLGVTSKTKFDYPEVGMPMLKTISISNLADYNDERLTNSEAFRKVMYSPELTELKLSITTELDEIDPGNERHFPEKYEFFRTLPETWLSPQVARKLEVLTLSFECYWGWDPRVEFRSVNPGFGPNDPNAGFPKLRVLSFNKYVFSHKWQIDWITSLGKQNGQGGLQELYLKNSPILWDARVELPMATGTTTIKLDNDESSTATELEVSNKGYQREDVLTKMYYVGREDEFPYIWPYPSKRLDRRETIQPWKTRWSDILDQWRKEMPALKKFEAHEGRKRLLRNRKTLRQRRRDFLQYIRYDWRNAAWSTWIEDDYSNSEHVARRLNVYDEEQATMFLEWRLMLDCQEVMKADDKAIERLDAAIAARATKARFEK